MWNFSLALFLQTPKYPWQLGSLTNIVVCVASVPWKSLPLHLRPRDGTLFNCCFVESSPKPVRDDPVILGVKEEYWNIDHLDPLVRDEPKVIFPERHS